ncbi:Transposase-like protein [Camponotus japonicus]
MAFYTNAEMADMHFMYGRANGNALEAHRLYAQNFPKREIPSNRIFAKLHQRLRDIGMFGKNAGDSGRPRSISTPEVEEEILAMVQKENPGISIRRIAAQIDISPRLIWRTLKEQLLYAYHIQRVQMLNPPDFRARLVFCRWILRKQARNVKLLMQI